MINYELQMMNSMMNFIRNAQFLAFVRKEFYHIFRDTRTLLILLAMPVAQIILFGFAISTEVKNAPIGVFNPSGDVLSRQITERFRASQYFSVVQFFNNTEEIDRAFGSGDIRMALVFSNNFDKNLRHSGNAGIQLIADGTDPNQALTITNYAQGVIASEMKEMVAQQANTDVPFQITPEVRMLYNPQMKGAYNFVPGVMGLIMTLICGMMTAIAIVREKETGTMEVLLASPIRPITIILAKATPYFAVSIINLTFILLLSVYVLEVPIVGSLFWLILLSLIFIISALAIGLLISTMVNSQVAAMLGSGMVLMMPVMLLSGLIFPVESMPAPLQWFSAILPARWFIEAVKKLMVQGVDVIYVAKEFIILTFTAALLIFVSLKRFKHRIE